ncbi:MAG: aminodeoxychorismate/anthranilate synthase component II [Muribaculum sp.]|nr:aminodeoxychorismate/anthranilate synthase component II [Muribaculaceae bacterium]MCM1081446.1 aminodeoxychorismate/anthranilate synthase component II [Muribaculum sp.]
MKTLVFDNYDSFTYNLVHALRSLGVEPDVVRNDKISVADALTYNRIVLSPGPGIPSEAGGLLDLLRGIADNPRSTLGVCLGHQAIAEAFGGSIYNLADVFHGVATDINIIADDPLFSGLDRNIKVGRYHSWAVSDENLPDVLQVTARSADADNVVMALRHRTLPIHGVQFHPESVLTPDGMRIIENWLNND